MGKAHRDPAYVTTTMQKRDVQFKRVEIVCISICTKLVVIVQQEQRSGDLVKGAYKRVCYS